MRSNHAHQMQVNIAILSEVIEAAVLSLAPPHPNPLPASGARERAAAREPCSRFSEAGEARRRPAHNPGSAVTATVIEPSACAITRRVLESKAMPFSLRLVTSASTRMPSSFFR
jgi:hypothetical protein